jgi:hypothetical protein
MKILNCYSKENSFSAHTTNQNICDGFRGLRGQASIFMTWQHELVSLQLPTVKNGENSSCSKNSFLATHTELNYRPSSKDTYKVSREKIQPEFLTSSWPSSRQDSSRYRCADRRFLEILDSMSSIDKLDCNTISKKTKQRSSTAKNSKQPRSSDTMTIPKLTQFGQTLDELETSQWTGDDDEVGSLKISLDLLRQSADCIGGSIW